MHAEETLLETLGAFLQAAQHKNSLPEVLLLLKQRLLAPEKGEWCALWQEPCGRQPVWVMPAGIENHQPLLKEISSLAHDASLQSGPVCVTLPYPQGKEKAVLLSRLQSGAVLCCMQQGPISKQQQAVFAAVTVWLSAYIDKQALQQSEMQTRRQIKQLAQEVKTEEETNEQLMLLSHELKNPLQIILSTAQCLSKQLKKSLKEAYTPEIADMFLYQQRNAYRLLRMVDNMLDARRAQSGLLLWEPSLCDFAALLHRTVEETARYSAPMQISFVCDTSPIMLVCDKLQTRRMILNLLTNVVKACKAAGTQTVTVTLAVVKDTVTLCIEDDGCGIAPESVARIGEKYYRAAGAFAAEQGTGLGVYLVRQLLKNVCGTLQYESMPGKGTKATLTVPDAFAAQSCSSVVGSVAAEYDSGAMQQQTKAELSCLFIKSI